MGDTPQLFWALWGLWQFYETRGNYQISLELAQQLPPLAQGQQDPVLLIEAGHALGENLYLVGEMTSARSYLEQGVALYNPQHHSRAHGAEGRAPEHRSREAQRAACRSAAGWRSRQALEAASAESEGP